MKNMHTYLHCFGTMKHDEVLIVHTYICALKEKEESGEEMMQVD